MKRACVVATLFALSLYAPARAIEAPRAGADAPDVTIIEYFDYNCPYCKKLNRVLQTLLSQDHRISVVYKDWPILGDVSEYAARAAIAAQWQGKYLIAHDTLFSVAHLATNDDVDKALARAGLDLFKLKRNLIDHRADIDSLLSRNSCGVRQDS